MTKTIKKYSLLIYNADGPVVKWFKKIRSIISANYEAVDNFVVLIVLNDIEVPGCTGKDEIYTYIGKNNKQIANKIKSSEVYGDVFEMDNSISLKYISKLIGEDIDENISYKDLICLINSTGNWQRNII